MSFFTNPLFALGGQLLGGIGAGLLDRKTSGPTALQKQQRQTIDQILQGVQGQGPYASAFGGGGMDAFERGVVQPSLQRFENQIAPQIQQSFIAGGQAGGSGLQNALTQAGVNLNSLIDQQLINYMNNQQQAQRSGISSILNYSEPEQSSGFGTGLNVFKGLGGFDSFQRLFSGGQPSLPRGFSS